MYIGYIYKKYIYRKIKYLIKLGDVYTFIMHMHKDRDRILNLDKIKIMFFYQ